MALAVLPSCRCADLARGRLCVVPHASVSSAAPSSPRHSLVNTPKYALLPRSLPELGVPLPSVAKFRKTRFIQTVTSSVRNVCGKNKDFPPGKSVMKKDEKSSSRHRDGSAHGGWPDDAVWSREETSIGGPDRRGSASAPRSSSDGERVPTEQELVSLLHVSFYRFL